MSTLCTSPDELAQVVNALILAGAIGGFLGAGAVSLIADGLRHVWWIWRTHRRFLRLRRRAVA